MAAVAPLVHEFLRARAIFSSTGVVQYLVLSGTSIHFNLIEWQLITTQLKNCLNTLQCFVSLHHRNKPLTLRQYCYPYFMDEEKRLSHVLSQVCMCALVSVIPWSVACQATLSMEYSRQEYRNGLPFPTPEDLPEPGLKPVSLASPSLTHGFFTNWATQKSKVTTKSGDVLTQIQSCLNKRLKLLI